MQVLFRVGHIDNNCPGRGNKRPPSMPEWISKATCAKCKKKGHLAFNFPPKFGNQTTKSIKFSKKKDLSKTESAAHVTEFAGIVNHKIDDVTSQNINMNYLFDKERDNLLILLMGHNRENAKKLFFY